MNYTSRMTYEQFIQCAQHLSELDTFPVLCSRAQAIGFKVTKVGQGKTNSLQGKMLVSLQRKPRSLRGKRISLRRASEAQVAALPSSPYIKLRLCSCNATHVQTLLTPHHSPCAAFTLCVGCVPWLSGQ